MPAPRSWTDQIDAYSFRDADGIALTITGAEKRCVSWRELSERSAAAAILMRKRGVVAGNVVATVLPNGLALIVTALAAWRQGATVLPLRWDAPARERERLLALAPPALVVAGADDDFGDISADGILAAGRVAPSRCPAPFASPPWLVASGGSSGLPKLVDAGGDTALSKDVKSVLPFGPVHLVSTPLYHALGLAHTFGRLIAGHQVVLMDRFDTERFLDIVEQQGINSFSIVPTMLIRLLRSPAIGSRSFPSLRLALISAGATPEWAVRAAIALFGKDVLHLGYGSSEGLVSSFISGREWLDHLGSVGIPLATDTIAVDEAGATLPPGEAGELYFRPRSGAPRFRYLGGSKIRERPDGWVSVGDIGKIDADGYLYILDRRTDMVKTGGSNVFVNEVEAALLAHPAVADVAVIGLRDADLGQRVHAIVELRRGTDPADCEQVLRAHCTAHLLRYKAPRSFEFVADLGRSEGGKLNRTALRDARQS